METTTVEAVKSNLMIGDEFFKVNPAKVLGTIVKKTNQYGKLYDAVTGNIQDELKKIVVTIPEQLASVEIETGSDSEVTAEDKIESSIKNIERKILQPKKNKRDISEGAKGDFVNDIVSYRESTEIYNKEISRVEMEAYLYVHPEQKQNLYIDETLHDYNEFISQRTDLIVTAGDGKTSKVSTPLVINDGNKLHYFAEFWSGDVLEKQKMIEANKIQITEKVSEDYYNELITIFSQIKPEMKRFNDPVEANRPVLLCHAKDARNFKVTMLKNGFDFKQETLLVYAFVYWLRNYYSALQYDGVTYLDVEKYIDNEDFFSAGRDAEKEEKKDAEKKNSEAYQKAKAAGDAAFSYFLAEMVIDEEREQLETRWNERFNKYVYPNLNKIPVGFTHSAKFKNGYPLKLSDVQRNSIAFMKLKGCGLLAYDVGVGKTLSAIINLSYALDNGLCKRPLLVVPKMTYQGTWLGSLQNNKVYDKDKKEDVNMYGVLPHLPKVNELFNLNTKLIKKSIRTYEKEDYKKFDAMEQSIMELDEILNKYVDKQGRQKTVNLEKIKKNDPLNNDNIKDALTDIEKVIHPEVMNFFKNDESDTGILGAFAGLMDANQSNKLQKWAEAKVKLLQKIIFFSKKYLEYLVLTLGENKPIEEKAITICTYEGFRRFGFTEETSQLISDELYPILTQGQKMTNHKGDPDLKKIADWRQKITKVIGQSKKDARIEFDAFGFDYICIDEAHNAKKIFTYVANEDDASSTEKKTRYKLQSGKSASAMGIKAFAITHYIQKNNNNRNVCLLTATPFTNSPLEIYSMISLTNHESIRNFGFVGLKEFFDYFIRTEFGFTIDAKNQPIKKEEVVGFVNLQSLRTLIYTCIDYKTGEEANVIRPCKITLPIKDTSVICKETAQQVEIPMIETIVKQTEQQMKYMIQIEDYMLGQTQKGEGIDFGNVEIVNDGDTAKDLTVEESEEGEETDNDEGTAYVINENDDDEAVAEPDKYSNSEYIEKNLYNIVVFMKKILPQVQRAIDKKKTRSGEFTEKQLLEYAENTQKRSDAAIKILYTYYAIKKDKDKDLYTAYEILNNEKEGQSIGKPVSVSPKDKEFVRIMKGLALMRALTLSPYLFKLAKLGIPSPEQLIETSPKLKYVMNCIKEIKDHQKKTGEAMKGIVIYCNLGTNATSYGFSAIELIRDYLITAKDIKFTADEVKIISGGVSSIQREIIMKDFNSGRVKVVIGSAAIKEGIDLQRKTIGLFNLTVDWNPTDAKQIEGRCWRQGNENAYVFINYVLLADSSDMVYFQKLQDKTSRIKQIWDRTGVKSQMDLKDFDPQQIKADLMTRADKIAVIEQDIEIQKVQRDNNIIQAKITEMEKARINIQNYVDSKDEVVSRLKELEETIVNYRRQERIAGNAEKIKDLKEQISELEFNEEMKEEDKAKEKEKLKKEYQKLAGKDFVKETEEMYKAEKDYAAMTNEQLAINLKAEIEKYRYGGTFFKYMNNQAGEGEQQKNIVNIRMLYSFFNPENTNSLAYKFIYSWKMADYYQDKYLKSLGLTIDKVEDYINGLVAESDKFDEIKAEIINKLPQRIEEIKDRIRRKTETYKSIEGRIEEFKTLFKLFNIPSGYGIATKEHITFNVEATQVESSVIEKPNANLSKKEIFEKKIKGFELLVKITKDAEKKAAIEKKLKGFSLLLKMSKFAAGGLIEKNTSKEQIKLIN